MANFTAKPEWQTAEPITIRRVVDVIVELSGVPIETIIESRARNQKIAVARALYASCLMAILNYSRVECAEEIGVNHTTAVHYKHQALKALGDSETIIQRDLGYLIRRACEELQFNPRDFANKLIDKNLSRYVPSATRYGIRLASGFSFPLDDRQYFEKVLAAKGSIDAALARMEISDEDFAAYCHLHPQYAQHIAGVHESAAKFAPEYDEDPVPIRCDKDDVLEVWEIHARAVRDDVAGKRCMPRALNMKRAVLLYLTRIYTLMTLSEIGAVYGVDHTTVCHATQRVQSALLEGNQDVIQLFSACEVSLEDRGFEPTERR
jgi:hypothetical protein